MIVWIVLYVHVTSKQGVHPLRVNHLSMLINGQQQWWLQSTHQWNFNLIQQNGFGQPKSFYMLLVSQDYLGNWPVFCPSQQWRNEFCLDPWINPLLHQIGVNLKVLIEITDPYEVVNDHWQSNVQWPWKTLSVRQTNRPLFHSTNIPNPVTGRAKGAYPCGSNWSTIIESVSTSLTCILTIVGGGGDVVAL